MSEEQKALEEKKEEVEEKVRPRRIKNRGRSDRRKTSKKVDINKTIQSFKEDFWVYIIDPSIDLADYSDFLDGNEDLDIDDVPDEHVMEFKCRRIDPGTLMEFTNSAVVIDIPDNVESLTDSQMAKAYKDAVKDRMVDLNRDVDIKCKVIHACTLEPQFPSPESVKMTLPSICISELHEVITEGAYGANMRYRFRDNNKK